MLLVGIDNGCLRQHLYIRLSKEGFDEIYAGVLTERRKASRYPPGFIFEKKSRNGKTTTHKTDFLISTTYEVVS
jgi:hypothetical protein